MHGTRQCLRGSRHLRWLRTCKAAVGHSNGYCVWFGCRSGLRYGLSTHSHYSVVSESLAKMAHQILLICSREVSGPSCHLRRVMVGFAVKVRLSRGCLGDFRRKIESSNYPISPRQDTSFEMFEGFHCWDCSRGSQECVSVACLCITWQPTNGKFHAH